MSWTFIKLCYTVWWIFKYALSLESPFMLNFSVYKMGWSTEIHIHVCLSGIVDLDCYPIIIVLKAIVDTTSIRPCQLLFFSNCSIAHIRQSLSSLSQRLAIGLLSSRVSTTHLSFLVITSRPLNSGRCLLLSFLFMNRKCPSLRKVLFPLEAVFS